MDKNITYQNLREEIMFLMKRHDNYYLAAYTISGSLWAVAITAPNAWLALIPLIILIPISLKILECKNAQEYISAYMLTCLEEKRISDWEYMRNKFQNQKGGYKTFISPKFAFLFLNLSSIAIFWCLRSNDSFAEKLTTNIIVIVFQIVFTVIQIVILVENSSASNRQKMIDLWKDILK